MEMHSLKLRTIKLRIMFGRTAGVNGNLFSDLVNGKVCNSLTGVNVTVILGYTTGHCLVEFKSCFRGFCNQ